MKYLPYSGHEGYVNDFYDILFTTNFERLALKHLSNYCNFKGCYANDEMACVFSAEMQADDAEYFGDNKVAYYFYEPAVKEDCAIFLDHAEFYRAVRENYEKHSALFGDRKNEMAGLLNKLRENLKLNDAQKGNWK